MAILALLGRVNFDVLQSVGTLKHLPTMLVRMSLPRDIQGNDIKYAPNKGRRMGGLVVVATERCSCNPNSWPYLYCEPICVEPIWNFVFVVDGVDQIPEPSPGRVSTACPLTVRGIGGLAEYSYIQADISVAPPIPT